MTLSLTFMVKVDGGIREPIYDFLLVNNSKYVPICSISQDIATQYMHDLEFDLSKSLKVEVHGAIKRPTYDFLLVNNYNYMLICIGYKRLNFPPIRPHYMKNFKVL